MYPTERIDDIRELEAFLFNGTPETAESVYERDPQGASPSRKRHSGLSAEYDGDGGEGMLILGHIRVDETTGEFALIDGPGMGHPKKSMP